MPSNTGASALTVIHHQGQPYISVSDLVGALSHMAGSLKKDSEQRKPLDTLVQTFEGLLGGTEAFSEPEQIPAFSCPFCGRPVVSLEALGQDKPVTVEVFSAPEGAWVPVDRADGSAMLVPWEPRLDGAGNVRVDTHRCTS